MEEEWGTLMVFMTKPGEAKGAGRQGFGEQLAIFGDERGRRGAELKVMSSVEEKSPGHFTKGVGPKTSDRRGFDTERLTLKDDEFSYCLGKQGSTRKKLAAASGCILQYVGQIAFLAGTLSERKRCRDFIGWLLAQRRGSITVSDAESRDDCTVMHVPDNCKGWVTGNRGSELRRVEQETSTFMFMALDRNGDESLIIFCHDAGSKSSDKGRVAAERLVNELVQEKLRGDGGYGGKDSRSPSRKRGRSDSRKPPPRQRSPSRRRS